MKDDQAKPTENKAEATSSKMTKMTRPGHSETSDPVRLKCRDLLNDALSVSCGTYNYMVNRISAEFFSGNLGERRVFFNLKSS